MRGYGRIAFPDYDRALARALDLLLQASVMVANYTDRFTWRTVNPISRQMGP